MTKKGSLNYRILIEKEKTKGKNVFVSYVPSLGISDFGKTVDEAIENTEKAIKLYIETLSSLKKEIPTTDKEEYYIVNKTVVLDSPVAIV